MFPSITIERFNKLDKNGDGLVTPDEQPTHGHGRGGALAHDHV